MNGPMGVFETLPQAGTIGVMDAIVKQQPGVKSIIGGGDQLLRSTLAVQILMDLYRWWCFWQPEGKRTSRDFGRFQINNLNRMKEAKKS